MRGKILFVGYVWPEPQSSAAGFRILKLIEAYLHSGFEVHFCSAARTTEFSYNLEGIGVKTHFVLMNHSSMEALAQKLSADVVVFDRFLTEEQMGARIQRALPGAVSIVDTEDFHSLREARRKILQESKNEFPVKELTEPRNLKLEIEDLSLGIREISALLRSDLNLMISDFETRLLQEFPGFTEQNTMTLPFMDDRPCQPGPAFAQRQHFISLGSFRHKPNRDATLWLVQNLFPKIRKGLPKAELHCFGSYPDHAIQSLHSPKEGVRMMGRCEDLLQTLHQYRVLLAPLRYGAGQKGKLLDAMQAGLPFVTTPIGIEGMQVARVKAGLVAQDARAFIDQSQSLYQNQTQWDSLHQSGRSVLQSLFDFQAHAKSLVEVTTKLRSELQSHRKKHFLTRLIRERRLMSSDYMSRWIEAKNRH